MAESKLENMTVDGEEITEKYVGKKTSGYTGKHMTDGFHATAPGSIGKTLSPPVCVQVDQ